MDFERQEILRDDQLRQHTVNTQSIRAATKYLRILYDQGKFEDLYKYVSAVLPLWDEAEVNLSFNYAKMVKF